MCEEEWDAIYFAWEKVTLSLEAGTLSHALSHK
jgi:hypothetical protein